MNEFAEEKELRRMIVKGVIVDSTSETPIVILRDDEEGGRFLPIWIGVFEASAIALSLEGMTPPRPMTHDLLANLCAELGVEVVRVVVSHLVESTFHAEIVVRQNGRSWTLDARASDSIAVALRAEAPIYVSEEVLEQAGASASARDEERIKKWLEEIEPEDLGEYTM